MISFVSTTFVERRPVSSHDRSDSHRADARHDERRAMGVACGAHALHDGYTDLIYVMLPIWQAEFGLGYAALGLLKTRVLRHAGRLADSRRPARRALRRAAGAGARHRARRRSAIASPALSTGVATAGGGAVRRRARRQHAASARLVADRARLRRPALAEGARHLQFRRRHRQDDGAGGGLAAVGGAAVAAGAGAARRRSASLAAIVDLRADAALPARGRAQPAQERRRGRGAARARATAFRCCFRSA